MGELLNQRSVALTSVVLLMASCNMLLPYQAPSPATNDASEPNHDTSPWETDIPPPRGDLEADLFGAVDAVNDVRGPDALTDGPPKTADMGVNECLTDESSWTLYIGCGPAATCCLRCTEASTVYYLRCQQGGCVCVRQSPYEQVVCNENACTDVVACCKKLK